MRLNSIGARTALWYACASTLTMVCLFAAGYRFLESHLVHGLDLMNEAEFHQIEAQLGPDYATMSAPFLEVRVRDIADFSYTLFYVEIHVPHQSTVFHSTNLGGHNIPDNQGLSRYVTEIPEVGEVRAHEFSLPPFEVVVATPLGPAREILKSYTQVAIVLFIVMLFISFGIGMTLSRMALRPIRRIRDTANRIRSDNLSERIPMTGARDEIYDLASLLNQMFDRLETAFGQIRRFTAEASHELKTPLSLIRLHSEKLLDAQELSASSQELIHVQLEELVHLNRIIDELLLLSRADANAIELKLTLQQPEPFLQVLAQDIKDLAQYHGLQFHWTHQGSGQVAFEQHWIRQVLLNVLTNAIQVSPPGGLLALESVVNDEVWQVCFRDQGPGVSPGFLEAMFERFVRAPNTVASYQGSGLGLAICRSIVELHQGRIFASLRQTQRGLCVIVELPVARV